jgi:hypothetical protein
MSTTREKALIWWGTLPFNSNNTEKGKVNYTFKYYGLDRKYTSLTGREIEEIYLKETLSLEEKESKFGMYKNDFLEPDNMNREELVKLILQKSKQEDILMILAICETEEVEQIYYRLYNIQ